MTKLLDCVISEKEDINRDLKYVMVGLVNQIAIQLNNKIVNGIIINVKKDNVIMLQFIIIKKIVINKGNCIGKKGSGCQETPYLCDQISENNFVRVTILKKMYLVRQIMHIIRMYNQKNRDQIYNKLKLPTYKAIKYVKRQVHFVLFIQMLTILLSQQVLQNFKLLVGCINKYDECQLALEQQCLKIFSGIHCKWDKINQKSLYQSFYRYKSNYIFNK